MQSSIEQTLNLACEHHQTGRLKEAEALYRQVLSVEPANADALHLLGVLAHQVGQSDASVELIGRAISINRNIGGFYNNLGTALMAVGRTQDAATAFSRASQLEPVFPEALSNLGDALRILGDTNAAIASIRNALALRSNYPEAYNNLGLSLAAADRLDDAVAAYRQALTLRPVYPMALNNLGNALTAQKQYQRAIDALSQALVARPGYADALTNLGNVYRKIGTLDRAITAYRQAIAVRPNLAEAYVNLSGALRGNGNIDEAISASRRATELKPDSVEAFVELGDALTEAGRVEEAIWAYRTAIQLQPNHAEAHWRLALALLKIGQLEEGWREAQWRWQVEKTWLAPVNFSQPQWAGEEISGKTILLHAEQGFGDSIHFARYAPLTAALGAKVIVQCHPELQHLLEGLSGVEQVISRNQPLPTFDVHCPFMSLPIALKTNTIESIPANVPYLAVDHDRLAHWKQRLANDTARLKVGLVWAGGPVPIGRSIPLSALAPLGQVPGVSFYSLQKGENADASDTPTSGLKLVDWTHDLHDFADTAALIKNLDLVITIDSAVAHLAGALASRTWLLLRFAADYRWLLDRPDSPWYHTMRLFRQSKPGDWESIVAGVGQQLRELAAGNDDRAR